MYKMAVYSQYHHELKLERVIPVESYIEAVVLAEEKTKYVLDFPKLLFSRVERGVYKLLNNGVFVGQLILTDLSR